MCALPPLEPGSIQYVDTKHLRKTGEIRPLAPYPVDAWIEWRRREYEAQCQYAATQLTLMVSTVIVLSVAAIWVFSKPISAKKPEAPAPVEQKADDYPGPLETIHPLNPWYKMLGL